MQKAECRARKQSAPHSAFRILHSAFRPRRGFTLMELLVVILIMSILAALAMSALAGATEQAREARTRAIIAKLDQLIAAKYDEYMTRPVPLRFRPSATAANSDPRTIALQRLYGIRELMRLEMPDRISDLCTPGEIADLQADNDLDNIAPNGAAMWSFTSVPGLTRAYKRSAARTIANGQPWTVQHQGAECLYLIVSKLRDGDKNALDFFLPSEIGDVDGDGMKEILDAWGQPVEFLRWAPGYTTATIGAVTMQTDDIDPSSQRRVAPEPFDPLSSDPRLADNDTSNDPYALYPLIYSAGRDRLYDINSELIDTGGMAVPCAGRSPPNDPYGFTVGTLIGTPSDANSDGILSYGDNITNHFQQTP